jgi:hypothetical protein
MNDGLISEAKSTIIYKCEPLSVCWKAKKKLPGEGQLSKYFEWTYKLFTRFAIPDFRFEALFLWMTPILASLSSIEETFGSNATASALSLLERIFFSALRVVFA